MFRECHTLALCSHYDETDEDQRDALRITHRTTKRYSSCYVPPEMVQIPGAILAGRGIAWA